MQTSAKISAMCVAGAVLLNILPWFGGPGWIWSVLLLGGAAWILKGRATQKQLMVWALFANAHALDNFYLGLGTLPWLAGAYFALRTIWPLFNLSRIRGGYAPYAVFGSLLCLWTLFWTWGKIAFLSNATLVNGLDVNSRFDADGNATARWLVPFYSPGYAFTGRALTGAFAASVVVLMLLGWTLWRDETARHKVRLLPLGGALYLILWSLPSVMRFYGGPILFFVGALGIGFCTFMALRGQHSGLYDTSDVAARVKKEVGKRTVQR